MKKDSSYFRSQEIFKYFPYIDLLIDVGVGNEFSEAWAFSECYPNCKIWGFEPNSIRFQQLKNVYPGELFNVAVSNKDGNITGSICNKFTILATPPENSSFEFAGNTWTKQEYPSITLDSLATENFSNIFLWADVEGAELLVLKGSINLLGSKRIIGINLEVRSKELVDAEYLDFWCSHEEICVFLKEFDYSSLEDFISRRSQDILWRQI